MLARKEIIKLKPYIPGKPIGEVKRELKLKQVVKLASNESALGPSLKAVRAIRKSLSTLNRYPDGGCFYLKQKLAQKLGLKPDNLMFGCGSDEIIVLALRAFVNPGDEVVIAYPTFLIYELASKIAGAKIKTVPLKNFRYDLITMKKAVSKKTKIVFIANPDNPTGTYVSEKEVTEFMKGLPKDTLVFFDEAYYELVDEKDFPDTLKYLRNRNVIVSRTFSKAYGLSGLRIGYGMAGSEIIKYLDKVREPFNVNSLAQVGALAALSDTAHLRRTRETLAEGKRYFYDNFDKLNLPYIKSVTNFVLFKIGNKAQKISQALLRKGVIVRGMQAWGMDKFIRVTIGTMPENRKFIQALKEVI